MAIVRCHTPIPTHQRGLPTDEPQHPARVGLGGDPILSAKKRVYLSPFFEFSHFRGKYKMTNQSPKLAWGHININVSNLERSITFYQKLGFQLFIPAIPYLGLTTKTEAVTLQRPSACALGVPENTRGRACIMQLDAGFPKIDLIEFDAKQQNDPLTNTDLGLVRICLVSQNLKQDYEQLTALGVEFISPPLKDDGCLADVAVCRDPDGTLIELLQVYLENWNL
jgi:catechol 2,3-dioxygenase-like lactoylglutathione lyase family enzyme